MKNILATWVCIDDISNSTYFPSAKGYSSDAKVQEIYWRCICCFFTTARYFNPDITLILFSNKPQLPKLNGMDVRGLLQKLNVEFHVTPFEYITPDEYYETWRNQFYEFSIFKFISNCLDFDESSNFILLDSDCIITGDLTPVFESIQQHQCITYTIAYDVKHTINGISRTEMKTIFEELLTKHIDRIPDYHAGEFYASTVKVVRILSADFASIWKQLMARHYEHLTKLNEEAHVLSFLFFKNEYNGGQANAFVKRLWTDPSSFRNVQPGDEHLLIWHLPAEKRNGFKTLFVWLKQNNFNLDHIKSIMFRRSLQKTFLIPSIPLMYKSYYTAKRLLKQVLQK